MSRISLKEQYDNKDVIQQVYDLKDKSAMAIETANQASRDSKDALSSINSTVKVADEAKRVAIEAKRSADVADGKAVNAQTSADSATTVAQGSLRDIEVVTTDVAGTIKATNNRGEVINHPFPIASGSKTGLMNAQTFAGLTNLQARVATLEGKATTAYVVFASTTPSQAEITSAFQTAQGRAPVAGDYATDIAKSLTYGFNGTAWVKVSQDRSIPQFAQGAFGVIKGGDPVNDGVIIAEPDGTGSVQGWDTVKADITNNSEVANGAVSRITALEDELPSYQMKVKGTAVAIASTSWVGNSVTVAVEGITAQSIVWVAPSPASHAVYGKSAIYATAQGEGTLTFTCKKVPSEEITVNVVVG